jgi:hypothetical protein
MYSHVTLEQVEQLTRQLPLTEQIKLLTHLSEQLSSTTTPRPEVDLAPRERQAKADALLQELDAIAESIEGQFDSAEDIRQIREERANRL